ncbi:MAG: hypothetical protein FJ288_05890 [Planctomycetes bacterium]|nr:hypothetical protein [Planctomycetota bacterium]
MRRPTAQGLAAAVVLLGAGAALLAAGAATGARGEAPKPQPAKVKTQAKPGGPEVVARPEPLRDLGRRHKVRLVYFVPKDRRPADRWAEKIPVLMTFVNDLYARDLRAKGYPAAGMDFEFQDGRPLVHLVAGKDAAAEYSGEPNFEPQRQWRRILPEVEAALGRAAENLYVVFAETYADGPAKFEWPGGMALGARFSASGGVGMFSAWILRDEFCATTVEGQLRLLADDTPISGRTALHRLKPDSPRFEFIEDGFGAVAHELGHAFGLPHDRRADDVEIMGNGFRHLRNNYLATPGPKAGFMADTARMLRWSRFLADDVDLADAQPPVARITHPAKLKVGATTILLGGEITDDNALGAIQFFSPRHDWVLGGMDLAGREVRLSHVVVVPPLEKGPLELVISIIDRGGNIGIVRAKMEVE